MREFKGKNVNDRLQAAAKAKQAMLQRAREMPGPNDPAMLEQRAQREAIARERQLREQARAEAKERAAAERAEQLAREQAELAAAAQREAEEKAKLKAELEAKQKAARDARYAARKNKK